MEKVLVFLDTAGIRKTRNKIEEMGIEKLIMKFPIAI